MKRIIIAMAAVLFSVMSATGVFAQNVSKTFRIANIHGIRVTGLYRVTLEEGDSDLVEVKCPEKTMKGVVVKEKNGILYLELDTEKITGKKNATNISYNTKADGTVYAKIGNKRYIVGPIFVKLQSRRLDVITMNGISSLTTTGVFKGGKTTVKLSGAAKVAKTHLSVEDVNIDISGAAALSLAGSFKNVRSEIGGASKVSIEGDMVDVYTSCSGASKYKLVGNINKGKVECSGASICTLSGSAQDLTVSVSGASKVNGASFTVRNAKVTASGASKASVKVLSGLKANASGASEICYYGNPATTDLTKSRGSSISGR